jgi:hypothetical protein
MWPTNLMSVGEVNDEGVPLDTIVNMRLSRVYGLATRQRVSLILQGFDDLIENEKDELFENSGNEWNNFPIPYISGNSKASIFAVDGCRGCIFIRVTRFRHIYESP